MSRIFPYGAALDSIGGKSMDGILPLWKPRGMTSHDCVMKIRRLLRTRKVGHTGTLDPEVEGVLPICIGQATKIVPFLTDTKKRYIAEIQLGTATETEDAHGEIIENKPIINPPSKQDIENVLQSFMGRIKQVPPMYSAVKVNGKKLYEYARQNIQVERPVREVIIYDIKLINYKAPSSIKIEVICSKGTYIRTLCVDIGGELGYPAHMHDLVRMETGAFSKENTVTFSQIEEAVSLGIEQDLLQPILKGIQHLDKLYVDFETKQKVQNGQKLTTPEKALNTDPFAVIYDETLLAIYQNHPEKPDQIKPVRVFNG